MPQPHRFHHRVVQVCSWRWIEIQRVGIGIMVPFAGRVEFLEDVLDVPIIRVHPHLAIVLPATFIAQRAVRVLPRDAVVVIAPEMRMHGVDVTAGRIGPASHALWTDTVGRVTVHDPLILVVVRISRHVLKHAAHEQLVGHEIRRHGRLEDPVTEWLPLQFQQRSAADHHLLTRRSLPQDWGLGGPRVLWRQHERVARPVDAASQGHRDPLPIGQGGASQHLRPMQRRHRFFGRTARRIVPFRGNYNLSVGRMPPAPTACEPDMAIAESIARHSTNENIVASQPENMPQTLCSYRSRLGFDLAQ